MVIIEPRDTFVELSDFDARELYNEYKKTYKKIHKYANYIRNKYKNTRDKDKLKERKVVYDTEREMLEILIKLENYLPYKERYYTLRELNKFLKLIYNKVSIVGFTPVEYEVDNIEEVVHNKILHNELLRMMKELLTKKQYQCLYMYFFNSMTLDEIGKKLNITHQTVSDYIKNAIIKLRKSEYLFIFIKNIF